MTAAARKPARPFVLVNMAMSADGKIASANRRVSTFSSPRDHDNLLRLRAGADAVLCGARTVDLNAIHLGPGPARFRRLRLRRGLAEYNLRVIASGSGSLDPGAAVFRHRFSPVLVLTTGRAPARALARLRRVADGVKICGRRTLDLPAALRWLREEWQVRRLVVEGGGELNDAFFRAGLVDELHLTLSPVIIGGRKAPTIAEGEGALKLAQAAGFTLASMRRIGDELYLVFRARRRRRAS
jgi:riboflavin-specific deaminase-like protein